MSAVLEIGNFEANRKAMNNAYEEYVLSVGDFDERIFLDNDAEEEIGTPAKSREEVAEKLAERRQIRNNLKQHFDQTQSLAPSTPLTGRRYLKEKDPSITPVSTATQSVSRLQQLLSGRQTTPSENLLELCKEHGDNLLESITQRVKDMGEIFCSNYVQPSDSHPGGQLDFAKRRLQLAECLYYKTLESIILGEKKRAGSCKDQKTNLSGLIEHEIFHRSLFACCLEIIIFSYNSQRMFPWIVDIFDLSPYHFYKVIEIIVREEEGLSRDVVKHLNHIEESILENLAWRSDSPLWEAIKSQNSTVPSCEDVTLPGQLDTGGGSGGSIRHPALTRLVQEGRHGSIHKPLDPLTSPTGPSVTDRFSSPSPGSAKRRLFSGPAFSLTSPTQSGQGQTVTLEKQVASGAADSVVVSVGSGGTSGQQDNVKVTSANSGTTQIITFHQAVTQDGRQVLIPLQTQVVGTGAAESSTATAKTGTSAATQQTVQTRPRKTGSLALFFRKVYHLASVRLRDLCDRLTVDDDDLHKKMWTCLEYILVQHIDLLQDRHLDQIIMCAVYVMAKVTNKPESFQNIMKCYRYQPQAQSHVYRSVLLTSRQRHTSGSSDGSRAEASGASSPVPMETSSGKDKKTLPMRSTSTLPIPHPSSHPPTPTRLIGNGAFEFGEERGDLIQFYNSLVIDRVKKFALKFSQNQSGDAPPLSPLPMMRCHTTSPRRVSQNHSVYISPHKQTGQSPTSKNGMHYCFNRSPAKNLRAINNMIKMKERNNSAFGGKRLLQVDEEPEDIPAKRVCLLKRLQNVNSDRQEANGAVIS